ncbi:transglycosylase SLT domain-containing protein [Streptomyces sp. NPDC006208]|uniref:transglycosylase SLT domain-containing protein n=1 Tax=Streptomyces sp. NPDC006208 TaxID=3156734 RepID=UPI0033A1849F
MILTLGQMSMLARAAGLPGDPDVWAAVGMAESSGDTNVVNGIGCVGIWQINQPVHVKSNPTWTVKWLQNPMNNAIAAKKIHKSQGWNAWEAYTGPDGTGSDGPWRQYYKKGSSAGAQPVDFDFWDPLDILPDGSTDGMPDLPGVDTVEGIADAIAKTADVLVNPQTWLRIAYGAIGVVLIAGGLFLLVKTTAVNQASGAVGKVIKGVTKTGASS